MDYDVIIVGGGIAGLTASIYIKRGNKNVLLLESSAIGGQILSAKDVTNYPGFEHISGLDLMKNVYKQALDLGVDIKYENVLSINGEDNNFSVNTNSTSYNARKIILSLGASPRKLGITNEDKYIGKGVSFCATCDGNFFKNKDVAVIGGGDVALDDALFLSDIVNKVYIVHRRNEFRAEASLVDKVNEKDNIELVMNSDVLSIEGNDFVEKIIVKEGDNTKDINVSGVFICIGRMPDTKDFEIDKDELGYIITDDNLMTSIKGIYAAGDVRKKEVRQLTTAAADGTICAVKILKELQN